MVLISSGKKKGPTVADIIAAAQAKAAKEESIDLNKHFAHLNSASDEARTKEAAKQRAIVAAQNLAKKEEQDAAAVELRERLLVASRELAARRIQQEFRAMQTTERGLAREEYRGILLRTKAERAAAEQEIRRVKDAAATKVQSLWRGHESRERAWRLRSLHTDLQGKIPLGSSAPKAAGASAKQALHLQGRAREVPLAAQLAAIHRGFRYMDANSTFNK